MNHRTHLRLKFNLCVLRPDNRQYAQQTLELTWAETIKVAVELPITDRNFWDVPKDYFEKATQEQLGIDVTVPKLPEELLLTPEGLYEIKTQMDFVKNQGMSVVDHSDDDLFEDIEKDF